MASWIEYFIYQLWKNLCKFLKDLLYIDVDGFEIIQV